MNITYTVQGDYCLPDFILPEQDNRPIGVWGQRHKNYLLHHHKIRYYNLLTSCKLVEYLADVNEQAEEMFSRLVKQMAEREGITEKLKEENQILWVGKMNAIRETATEIVYNDLIFV